jgi:drug/metabolite transporter (DMT)-like permease
LDQLTNLVVAAHSSPASDSHFKKLQAAGVLSGFAAGAWLGAAEAPTKLVQTGMSPVVISLLMVLGVFVARWSLPALVRGQRQMLADFRHAPHLVVWAVLAGSLWAVANTLTIFAIRNIGLSIAFPLWNTNSLLGIFWGFLLFKELRDAGRMRWLSVVGGALVMFAGAALLAVASSTTVGSVHWLRGVVAALGAGVLWGTMYIPYRKAYLTGMNPLSFVSFFTIGELGMMMILAVVYSGGYQHLKQELIASRNFAFWIMFAGFIWVIGDLFQQYAAKYIGISRGIPLSNSNQIWGLLWGILVFGELHGRSSSTYLQVVSGSLLMAAGAGAIALASVGAKERTRWQEAISREINRYGIAADYAQASIQGNAASSPHAQTPSRTWIDWLIVTLASAVFIVLGAFARPPQIEFDTVAAMVLLLAAIALLLAAGTSLWKTTRFN